jgi:serine/threonine protein kinase
MKIGSTECWKYDKSMTDIMVPLIIFGSITVWVIFPKWLRHKAEMAREALKLTTQADSADVKKLRERVENLENLVCRLDSELNVQLEKSLSSGMVITSASPAGVSQMPTTFMNVAAALEARFQVLKELGRGGMGIVFQAHDKELKEQVAIKILSPILSTNADALARLKREVSSARRVTHPNVIRIHDLSEMNGLHFVTMEYFHGQNLKEYIKVNGALSNMKAWQIAEQICDGLDAAHRGGIVHRDLKSQNIIINTAGQIKIIDFGLAHTTQMEGLTATGLIMGTPEYMAPEQVSGKRVDERADIYSFGIILYELFTGKVPFSGDSAIAVGFMQMKDPPQPPHEINPQIPPEIETVILKCLEKEPNARFASIVQVKTALQNAIHAPAAQDLSISRSQRDQERVQIKS